MSGSTRDLIEKIPKLKKQICNLTSELEDLVYIQAINSLNISGTNLEITFLNQDGLLQTLSQDLFTIQESEIQDNVLNYTALNSIVNPDLYQFAYVRESQGIKFISYILKFLDIIIITLYRNPQSKHE